ncbi:Protein of unknown function [Pilibacter termitis]|uniref:DUF3021 domain-containing protein n=1 Tax=Pilibacter termitis TaxID=263852 RepID=A0A1T4NVA2_9ENTE|nr:DUF3021 domain-containing protein [Pilibacter termitis]SJZ83174.1 Protein of unknown function [Pilibacter termitis]
MKTVVKLLYLGISLGSILFTLSALVFSLEARGFAFAYLLLSLFIALASAIYEVEKLTLLTQTLFHLGVSYIAYLAIAFYCKWIPMNFVIVLTSTIFFLILFFIIWFVMYLYKKRKIERINQKLS